MVVNSKRGMWEQGPVDILPVYTLYRIDICDAPMILYRIRLELVGVLWVAGECDAYTYIGLCCCVEFVANVLSIPGSFALRRMMCVWDHLKIFIKPHALQQVPLEVSNNGT